MHRVVDVFDRCNTDNRTVLIRDPCDAGFYLATLMTGTRAADALSGDSFPEAAASNGKVRTRELS